MNEIISLFGKYHRDFIGIYPRIATIYPKNEERKNQTIIGIMPDKILEFLDDLIDNIDNEVIKSHQNVDIRGFKGGRQSALECKWNYIQIV